MQAFIEAKREEIAELCRMHHVRRLSVFGSAVRDDFDPERSDVDLLVEFSSQIQSSYLENFVDLEQGFEHLFERRVDLISRNAIRNPILLGHIERDRVQVYAA